MRRWNGWGDESTFYALPANGLSFLHERVGTASALADAPLPAVLARVPASRLPDHLLVNRDPLERLRHARGQSLPDWLALRSGDLQFFPDGVAFPVSAAEVRALFDYARSSDAVLIPYGGGTSVVGHITPQASKRPVLTVDLSRMNQLLNLDPLSRLATFGAGASGPQVEAQLRARGYTLGHFPQSFELSTLGGWITTRSSGQQSLRYGRIEQLFAGGRLETPLGTLEIPSFPASAAGPDLREWVLGSEGRLGILTQASVRVSPLPNFETFHVLVFPDWQQGVAAARALVQSKFALSMLRLSNPVETETQLALAGAPRAVAWLEKYLAWRGAGKEKCLLTLGVSGDKRACQQTLKQAKRLSRRYGGVDTGSSLGKKWVHSRFRSPYLRETLWQAGYAVDTLETATDWPWVAPLVAAVESSLRNALVPEKEKVHVFTHLSHLYAQGSSIYTTYVFRVGKDYSQTLARWQRLKQLASEAIVAQHGTISHQHGVGVDHAPYLAAEKGELGIHALRALCQHFDPEGRMNPGKLLMDN